MKFLDKLFGNKKKETGKVLSDFDKLYFTGKELGKGAFGSASLHSGRKGSDEKE
jgi:hypothetical protein